MDLSTPPFQKKECSQFEAEEEEEED